MEDQEAPFVTETTKAAPTEVATETEKSIGTRDTNVPWYTPAEDAAQLIGSDVRELLVEYSGIPAEEVERHVISLRDKAWQIFPYPCIGQFRFLSLSLSTLPSYTSILSLLKSDPSKKLADIGCCVAQNLRKLIYDGVESSQLVGIDIEERFMELGYDLFLDRSKFAGQFFAVDLLNVADEEKLKEIKESLDIIYISSFLHLFPYGSQYSACVKLSSLLKSKGLILGRQIGSRRNPGEKEKKSRPGENSYFHDEESFTRMWEDVGREVGIKWSVRAWFDVGRYSWGVKMGEKKEGKGKEEEEEEEGEQWKGDKEWLYFEVTRL